MGETAVLVNELGEVAIDHHLLRRVDERTVVLDSGCVCCTLRGDLADELRDLLARRARGEIPAFRRVVVETTGLADPAPVVYTLALRAGRQAPLRARGVVTTVDAQHGLAPRRVGQAGRGRRHARRDEGRLGAAGDVLRSSGLRALNPAARVRRGAFGASTPDVLLRRPSATRASRRRRRRG